MNAATLWLDSGVETSWDPAHLLLQLLLCVHSAAALAAVLGQHCWLV
jgi:hypothetical protein